MELIPFADRGPPLDQDMGCDLRILSYRYVFANDRIGADRNALGDLCLRMHNRS
jgi:hypothetical protein